MLQFNCDRTCPQAGERWCRFRALLDRLGPVQVDSHTARVVVEYRDQAALKVAVLALGGTWTGQGKATFYDGTKASGLVFQLPGWRYPCVAQANGQLAYDVYEGEWGNVQDLERLRGAYARTAVELGAAAQGWQCERLGSGGALVIYHPSGGTLTYSPEGVLEANGFHGAGCHDAMLQLGLPMSDLEAKAEYGQVAAAVQQTTATGGA